MAEKREEELLERLERLIDSATSEIEGLRETKTQLEERVSSLEEQVATLESDRVDGQKSIAQWTEEKDAIETKLEGLVEGLETLLED